MVQLRQSGLNRQREILLQFCRIGLALCILADGAWYLASYETRAAYFRSLGIPTFFIYVAALTYFLCGFRILINYQVESACLGMIIAYGIVLFLVHHLIGPGGIGDYPRELHGEMNLFQLLKYMGMIGTVFIMNGYVDFKNRGGLIMEGTKSYSIVLGRAAIGVHFIIENVWFRLIQYELRSKQVLLMGRNPVFHVWILGLLYITLGILMWLGEPDLRRISSLFCASLTFALAIWDKNSLTMSVGVYNMKFEAAFHQHVMNFGIIIGCLFVFILGDKPVSRYKEE